MDNNDITFTVGLDTSEAEAKLAELDEALSSTVSQDDVDTVVGEPTEISSPKGNNSLKDKIHQAVESELQDAFSRLDASTENGASVKENAVYSTEDIKPNNKSLKSKIERAVEEAWSDVILDINGKASGETEISAESDEFRGLEGNVITENRPDWDGSEMAIEAPREKDATPEDLSDFRADDLKNKWSQDGTDAYSRISLQAERSAARQSVRYNLGYNKYGYINDDAAREAAERYARADGALRTDRLSKNTGKEDEKQEEVTGELKEQGREYNDQIIKLGKIAGILASIKALVDSIKKLWNTLSSLGLQAIKDDGFITKDFNGFMQSATDKRYTVMMEGLRNMGDSAPFSEQALNSVMSRVENERQKVLRGGALDKDYVISTQWLKDKVGIDLGAKELLSGSKETTTANVQDAVYKVEKYIASSGFQNKSAIEQSQDMKAIRDFLGDEITDSLAANVAMNAKTGNEITVLERIVQNGFSGLVNNNNDTNARIVNDAWAGVVDEFKILLKRLFDEITPFTKTLFEKMKNVVTGVQKHLTTKRSERQVQDIAKDTASAKEKLSNASSRGVKAGATAELYGETPNATPQEMAERHRRAYKLKESYKDSEKTDYEEADKLREEVRSNPLKINELSQSDRIEDVLNANMLRMDNVGSNDWTWGYEGDIGLRSMLTKAQTEGIYEKDGRGGYKIKQFDNDAMNELAKYLSERIPDKDTLESLSPGELLEQMRFWANQGDAQTLQLMNSLIGEGGALDIDSSSTEGISGYFDKVRGVVGEEATMASMLHHLSYFDALSTGGQYKNTDMKFKELPNGNIVVDVTVHSADPNSKSVSESFEFKPGMGNFVRNTVKADMDFVGTE